MVQTRGEFLDLRSLIVRADATENGNRSGPTMTRISASAAKPRRLSVVEACPAYPLIPVLRCLLTAATE